MTEPAPRRCREPRPDRRLAPYWTMTAFLIGAGAAGALLAPSQASGLAAGAGAGALWLAIVARGVFSPRSSLFMRTVWRSTPRPGEPPRVALTFDDGPHPTYTPEVLDVLRANDARATFFVIGRRAEEHPEIVRAIAAEGHGLGNHTYEHDRWTNFFSVPRLVADIARAQVAIERASGVTPVLFRPPVGLKNPRVAAALRRLGLQAVTWRLSGRDNRIRDGGAITSRLLDRLRPGDVVLLHDGVRGGDPADRTPTVQALAALLPRLRDRGWAPVTAGDLFARSPSPPAAPCLISSPRQSRTRGA